MLPSTPPRPDLSRDSDIWQQVVKAMPRLAAHLARRFPDRHGASAQEAVSSAVRVLLGDLDAGEVTFSDLRAVFSWLGKTAANKLRDRMKKEHLDRRGHQDLDRLADRANEWLIQVCCDEAIAQFDRFRDDLGEEERTVLDGRLEGKSLGEIASAHGWTLTRVETILKRLKRRADRLLAEVQP